MSALACAAGGEAATTRAPAGSCTRTLTRSSSMPASPEALSLWNCAAKVGEAMFVDPGASGLWDKPIVTATKVARLAKYVTLQVPGVPPLRESSAAVPDRIRRFGIGRMKQPRGHESQQERSFFLNRAVRSGTMAA